MAYASWLNISVANGRSALVYRLWKAVAALLSGDMAGKWTVIDVSTGTAPTWAADTDPSDGAWVVVQCETPNADGTKLQVFLGFRSTTGTLAGFGTKAAGIWFAASPKGGWDTTNNYFGAANTDWRNGPGSPATPVTLTGYTGATVMSLILTSGTTNRPGSLYLLTRQGTGDYAYSFAACHLAPPSGLSDATSRMAMLYGIAAQSGATSWLQSGGAQGSVPAVALDGWTGGAYLTVSAYVQDRESSAFVESLVGVYDVTAGKNIGLLDQVYRCAAANGTPTVDGTGQAYGGFLWPREASRDGAWV